MHYPDEAIEEFEKVMKLDPKNKDARTYYNIAKKKVAEYRVREKKIYGKFSSFFFPLTERFIKKPGKITVFVLFLVNF